MAPGRSRACRRQVLSSIRQEGVSSSCAGAEPSGALSLLFAGRNQPEFLCQRVLFAMARRAALVPLSTRIALSAHSDSELPEQKPLEGGPRSVQGGRLQQRREGSGRKRSFGEPAFLLLGCCFQVPGQRPFLSPQWAFCTFTFSVASYSCRM